MKPVSAEHELLDALPVRKKKSGCYLTESRRQVLWRLLHRQAAPKAKTGDPKHPS
jgi:hypothetical protein